MELVSAPKVHGSGAHRVVGAADTLRRVRPLLPRVGVTRVADITGLDRIGIPTYSAIVPRSRDILSVYNGKGATKLDAKVGAVMEAIERNAALHLHAEVTYGAYQTLRQHRMALEPASLGIGLHPTYDDSRVAGWVEGYDLLRHERVLVPAEAAAYNVIGRYGHPCYAAASTNGLASGNTREEAVCHALCELIERDAWTIAELLSHWLPRARQARGAGTPPTTAGHGEADDAVWDDVERYPNIDLRAADGRIRRMLGLFRRAGLQPLVKDITSDMGIPTVLATAAEEVASDFPRAHFGLGTHPDVRVAVTRALSELAQSRVVDIQGVREDISAPAEEHPYLAHTKRVSGINRRSWYHRRATRTRTLAELPTFVHADVLDDVRLMLARLRASGLGRVVVVDLTRPDVGVPVVRVLIPGIESWAADRTRIGTRAVHHWRRAAAAALR